MRIARSGRVSVYNLWHVSSNDFHLKDISTELGRNEEEDVLDEKRFFKFSIVGCCKHRK